MIAVKSQPENYSSICANNNNQDYVKSHNFTRIAYYKRT